MMLPPVDQGIGTVGEWFAESMTGSMLVALPIAVLAGAISFFSPCVVPLLPGYLSYVTGLSAAELGSDRRGRMLAGTALFVAGFSAVFILTGVVFGKAGDLLIDHQTAITRVLGALTVVLGLVFLGGFGFLQKDCGCIGFPRSGSRRLRCSAYCSDLAGRRVSGRRSGPS